MNQIKAKRQTKTTNPHIKTKARVSEGERTEGEEEEENADSRPEHLFLTSPPPTGPQEPATRATKKID